MSGPAIDDVAFAELQQSAGADFVHELVDTFLEEAPRMLAELRSAAVTGRSDAFRRAAHSLKSNANTFGALTLGSMARELELNGAPPGGDEAAIDTLAAEYGRVAARLAELRGV
ncbi:MAG TPA: Hpt domain-containing protein [Caldimonas sp.]|jgi:HPt (histidine-containing phosphotransfer) domain-containing protein|nr:Hpt domain-containing protein [Caldimonas sp.]HEX4234167.1 Hpt domain-containing protein [Caldimonas sp.]